MQSLLQHNKILNVVISSGHCGGRSMCEKEVSSSLTSFHCSGVQSSCSLASLISGFIKPTQMFDPILWAPSTLCVWKCSKQLYCFSAVWFHQTLKWSSIRIIQEYFPTFPQRWWFPAVLQILMFWIVLNPVLAVSAISLDVFSAWCSQWFDSSQTEQHLFYE